MGVNRLGIFLFWDPDGIVDDYITYLLNDITNDLSDLVVVVNGYINDVGRKKIEKFTSKIFTRNNDGFDVGGWKDALVNFCGFSMVKNYDELVLFNDSFFGPFYSFSEVFRSIEDDIDFWGLSVHGEANNVFGECPYGYRPRYLQTYFLVIRKKMLESEHFENFWVNIPYYSTFNEVSERFSCVFTKYFSDLGYKWCAYSDTGDLESTREKAMSYHTFNTYDMISNRKFPIIKRKAFITEKGLNLRYNYADELARSLEFIKDNYSYDVNMIYKYLLRKYNLLDLKRSMNWNTILSEKNISFEKKYCKKKIIVIAHLFYPDLFEYALNYLKNTPDEAEICITTESEIKMRQIESLFRPVLGDRLLIRIVDPRGRDLSALLVGCKDLLMKYDYLCFVHDKKSVQKEFSTVGSSFSDLLWDNVLKSKEFVHNVLNEFEREESLGLLVPPNVYHGSYFSSALDYWTICYNKTLEISNELGLDSNLDPAKPPISVGTVFWCKTAALRQLFEYGFEAKDFPKEPLPGDGSFSHALERILPYIAQHHGYYTSTLMSSEYAQAEVENYRYMLNNLLIHLRGIPGVQFNNYQALVASMDRLKENYRKISNGSSGNEHTIVVEKLVEIGVKGAVKNYINKKLRKLGLRKEKGSVCQNENSKN